MKDKLLEVIEILNKYDLNEVEYESEGIKVKVRKDNKSIVQNNDFTNNLTSNSYEFEKAEKTATQKKLKNLNFETEVPRFESQPRMMSFIHYKE